MNWLSLYMETLKSYVFSHVFLTAVIITYENMFLQKNKNVVCDFCGEREILCTKPCSYCQINMVPAIQHRMPHLQMLQWFYIVQRDYSLQFPWSSVEMAISAMKLHDLILKPNNNSINGLFEVCPGNHFTGWITNYTETLLYSR